ncbi:unnamed protein product [Adineta steineri]|uniref:DOMON domain-containing protein n=1 Tax=Adineta steineri TaxID=433720 RepID=A0A813M609_9BILA|nr:unnamed protein product [Adineta steineri]
MISTSFINPNFLGVKSQSSIEIENGMALWFDILIDVLLNMTPSSKSRLEMIHQCRLLYENDVTVLKKIDEFENTYVSSMAIKWYTHDSFIYRLFNQAFREQNIDFIYRFRSYLCDLHEQLQRFSTEQWLSCGTEYNQTRTILIYRGQGNCSLSELQKYVDNIDNYITFNSFLSVTRNQQLASIYADTNKPLDKTVALLFQMELDPVKLHMSGKPLASISHLSAFPEEDEFLLSAGTVFCIMSVGMFKFLLLPAKGSVLRLMGQYAKAEYYYYLAIEQLPFYHFYNLKAHQCLGILYENKGLYDRAIHHYEDSLACATKYSLKCRVSIANTYILIGQALRNMGDLTAAEVNFRRAIDYSQLHSDNGNLNCYGELGQLYRQRSDYALARSFFQQQLDLEIKCHGGCEFTPALGTAYNNLGEIDVAACKDLDQALGNLNKALEIRIACLPPNHTDLSTTFHNIAHALVLQGRDLDRALELAERALAIDRNSLPPNHPHLSFTLSLISDILYRHFDKTKLSKALTYAEQALRIALKNPDKQTVATGSIYLNIARLQLELKDFDKSMKMLEKGQAWALAHLDKNGEHLLFANIYYLFGSWHYLHGDSLTIARNYMERALSVGLVQTGISYRHKGSSIVHRNTGTKFVSPTGNVGVNVTWTFEVGNITRIHMAIYKMQPAQWAAIGLNLNRTMGPAHVFVCRRLVNDTVDVNRYMNPGKHQHPVPAGIAQGGVFTVEKATFDAGVVNCQFTLSNFTTMERTNSNDVPILSQSIPYHPLVAIGALNATNSMKEHGSDSFKALPQLVQLNRTEVITYHLESSKVHGKSKFLKALDSVVVM